MVDVILRTDAAYAFAFVAKGPLPARSFGIFRRSVTLPMFRRRLRCCSGVKARQSERRAWLSGKTCSSVMLSQRVERSSDPSMTSSNRPRTKRAWRAAMFREQRLLEPRVVRDVEKLQDVSGRLRCADAHLVSGSEVHLLVFARPEFASHDLLAERPRQQGPSIRR